MCVNLHIAISIYLLLLCVHIHIYIFGVLKAHFIVFQIAQLGWVETEPTQQENATQRELLMRPRSVHSAKVFISCSFHKTKTKSELKSDYN